MADGMPTALKLCFVAVDLGPWLMAGLLVLLIGLALGRWSKRS
jgi:hypothetical protein